MKKVKSLLSMIGILICLQLLRIEMNSFVFSKEISWILYSIYGNIFGFVDFNTLCNKRYDTCNDCIAVLF